MSQKTGYSLNRGLYLRTVSMFLVSFLLLLPVWIWLKNYYATGLTHISLTLASLTVGGINFIKIDTENGMAKSTFEPVRYVYKKRFHLSTNTFAYTYNMPLTMAIVVTLLPHIRKRGRVVVESLFLVVFIHLCYLYFGGVFYLVDYLIKAGIYTTDTLGMFLLGIDKLLYEFLEAMILRFEPFLMAIYIYSRFRSTETTCNVEP
ncbi:hypothetical protein [Candidatus Magnetobacterium casense]|uniref:Uncharacterized protein n=1 Tax=Candidatus Magnetobacterium casense TaxID=1455061 RepID=A0ABS6RUZ9_9BACT|nr:hypothetical protein [Candidatus Magnetobacterium casensis]MBV6340459.1 hypothetical protein [Candidatus Magnetobacterium casensis]